MSSIVARGFDGPPAGRKVYVNRVLDRYVLRVQPTTVGGVVPPALQIPGDHECVGVRWISEERVAVLFENKGFFWVVDASQGVCVEVVELKSGASAVDAISRKVNGVTHVWVLDSHNRLCEYIFEGDSLVSIRDLKLDAIQEPLARLAFAGDRLLLVSNALYVYNLEEGCIEGSLNLFVDQCACVQVVGDKCLVSARNDRFVNLVDLNDLRVRAIFSLSEPCLYFEYAQMGEKGVLVSLSEKGGLEMVVDPLSETTAGPKRRRQQVRTLQPQYTLALSQGRFDTPTFNGGQLVLSYFENESFYVFDNFNWVDNMDATGEIVVPRLKALTNKLDVKNNDASAFKTYSEKNVVVGTSDNLLDIDENGDGDEDDADQEDFASLTSKLIKPQSATKGNKVQFAVGTLSMNLVQALKTNDSQAFNSLLDKAQDEQVIRNTVARLDIHYVMKLLDKLGELNYKNKFQALDLNVWVKYLLIFHGNYIVGVPHLKSKLTLLTISLKNRAANMEKLLELKARMSITIQRVDALREIQRFEATLTDGAAEDDVEYYEELEDAEDAEDVQDVENGANGPQDVEMAQDL